MIIDGFGRDYEILHFERDPKCYRITSVVQNPRESAAALACAVKQLGELEGLLCVDNSPSKDPKLLPSHGVCVCVCVCLTTCKPLD